jgi:hypothetical protein
MTVKNQNNSLENNSRREFIIKGTMLTRGGAVVHPQFRPAAAA